MNTYRFSPIISKEQLLEAIKYIHFACYDLCKKSFGVYYPNAGNMAVFCHYEEEYSYLDKLRQELCEPSDDPNQKYFRLKQPIMIPPEGDIPGIDYPYLYIRKLDPSPYGQYAGDIDFYMDNEAYSELKARVAKGGVKGAQVYDRPGWDMIQLFDPKVDVVGYVSTISMVEKARVRQNS